LENLTPGVPSGHEVLLDFDRLDPGAKWRNVLDEWMASCHAAVVMLDKVALSSPWVLKEATILAHRAARDAQFLLFPVLLDGVQRTDLSKDDSPFSKLYLDAIQRVSKTAPQGIAEEVLQELGKLSSVPKTPLDELADALSYQLETANSAELERICVRLTGKSVNWSPQDSRAERCAREIALAIVRGERGGYATGRELIRSLSIAGLVKERAKRALNYAAPLWVAGRSAATLADLAQRNASNTITPGQATACWATVINGAYVPNYTADIYVRRAYLPKHETIRTIDGGESDARAEDLIDRIRTEVKNRERLSGAKPAAIDRFLSGRTTPYFIVLPPPCPDEVTLRTLQNQYPRVTFILHTGEDLPDDEVWPARVVPLTPSVDLDMELAAYGDYNGAIDDIEEG
jgi:hypothetical protein